MAQKTLDGVFTSTMLSSAFGQTTLASWGEAAAGELYLADNFNNIIYRMESRIPTAFIPVTFR